MIVTFGDAIVDLFALPRGRDVASAEHFVPRQGGAPANVAVVAARLGAPVRFVGAVGRDAHGERLARELAEATVDVSCIVRLAERTGVTFVRVAEDGARSFLFYRQGGADLSLAAAHLEAIGADPLAEATWLQLMSSALVVEPMASATRWIMERATARNVLLSLDLNVRAHLWTDRERMVREVRALAALADVLKASEEDLEALGLPATLEGARSLVRKPGAVPILTLAERGAIACVGAHEFEVPAADVKCVDTTGAGDAFVGAMLAGLLARGMAPHTDPWRDDRAWREVIALACRVGSLAVTELGATEGVRALGEERSVIERWRKESGR